jgi:hypothetical protein
MEFLKLGIFILVVGGATWVSLTRMREGYLADYMRYQWCACRDTMAKRLSEAERGGVITSRL